jgi:hypothetical protein
MLLVYDEVEIVELVFCGTRFFPDRFRQNTVEFCADDQFFPRTELLKHEQA